MKTVYESSGTLNAPNICIIWVPEGEEGPEKIFEEIIAKTSLTWEKKQSSQSRKNRETQAGLTQGVTCRDKE